MQSPDHEPESRGLMRSSDWEAATRKIANAVFELIATVPKSHERESANPGKRSQEIADAAAAKAALAAGGLALPPGPLGWVTILPELLSAWRIQAQMVADIAAVYGVEASLTREHMVYCLFRHAASQAVRDLVVRVGERVLVQRMPARALQSTARLIGWRITQRTIGKSIARWLPVIGALGVGAYAYYDTEQVARTAIGLFQERHDARTHA